jgi:hypothetical protein
LLGQELDWFPRKILTSSSLGQVLIYSQEELLQSLDLAGYVDCYIQTHTAEDQKKEQIRVVFIDIDLQGKLDRALKLKDRVLSKIHDLYNVKAYSQFSGFKGYHVIVPLIKTIQIPGYAKDFLRFLQVRLSLGYCDPQILGDIVRLVRLPHTYNSKAPDYRVNGLVTPVDEWDGKGLDVSLLWEEFKLTLLEERLRTKARRGKATEPRGLRPQILTLIERAKKGVNLTHVQRLAILFEALNQGLTDSEIHAFFKNCPDYNQDRTQHYIDHARRSHYRPFTTKHLEEALGSQ